MNHTVINIADRIAAINDYWQPEILRSHGFQFRLVKLLGDFGWHTHTVSDKVMLVVQGRVRVDFADGSSAEAGEGEILVVPKNCSHRPHTEQTAAVVLIELPEPDEAA